jgi:hypothetical protein
VRGEGWRIETHINGVWCEVFSAESCKVKNMQEYLGNNVIFEI